jgi:lipopolysaccharide export system protein LptA
MARLRKSTVFSLLVLAALLAAVIAESLRPRPPASASINSQPPERPDEVTRLEGGFSWASSDGQRQLFELFAESLVGTEGGAHFLQQVSPLTLHLEDGRTVTVRARTGRLQERDGSGKREAEIGLAGEVVVQDPDGVTLRSESLAYDTVTRVVSSDSGVRLDGQGIAGQASRVRYYPDRRVIEADGRLEVDLQQGAPWQIDAAGGVYRLDAREIEITTPFVARMPGQTVLSGPGLVRLADGKRPTSFTGNAPVLVSGPGQGGTWQLAAWRLEAVATAGGEARLAGIDADGPTSFVMRREAAGGGEERGVVHAPRWTIRPKGGGWQAVGGPGFDAEFTVPRQPAAWRVTGGTMELVGGHGDRPERLFGSGGVVARGPEEIVAEADSITWEATDPNVLRLEGNPARTRQRGDVMEAPVLRLLRDQATLIAERDVVAEVASVASGSDSIFSGKEPVHVKGTRATVPRDEKQPIEFAGPVQAWQGGTILRAARLTLQRAESRLIADGDFVLRIENERPGQARRTMRLSGERLVYLSRERSAHVTGGARFVEGAMTVDARELRMRGAPGGGIEHLEGEGGVVLSSERGTATADRLVWEGGEKGTILLVGEKELVTLKSPEGALTRSERVRYYLTDGRFQTEGESGRALIEGKPAARPRPADDEKK